MFWFQYCLTGIEIYFLIILVSNALGLVLSKLSHDTDSMMVILTTVFRRAHAPEKLLSITLHQTAEWLILCMGPTLSLAQAEGTHSIKHCSSPLALCPLLSC